MKHLHASFRFYIFYIVLSYNDNAALFFIPRTTTNRRIVRASRSEFGPRATLLSRKRESLRFKIKLYTMYKWFVEDVVTWASPPTSLRIIWIVWMYRPRSFTYLTPAIVFRSIDHSVLPICFTFFLFLFFFLDETRTCTCSNNVKDLFLFRFSTKRRNSFDSRNNT